MSMNETEFVTLSENIFDHIDDYVSDHFDAFDTEKSGNVLTLEHEDGAQIIINRHAATAEQAFVGSVDDGIYGQGSDVGLNLLDAHLMHDLIGL